MRRPTLPAIVAFMTGVTLALIAPPAGAVVPPGNGSMASADAKIVGNDSGSGSHTHLGEAVAGAGDTNADGFDDFVVRDQGAAYLFLGPVAGTLDPSLADAVFTPNSTTALLRDVSGAGDVNNDGFDDLLIGMSSSLEQTPGHAWLIYGPMSGTMDLNTLGTTLTGEADGDLAGFAVTGAGDVNDDGFDDILIGAPGNDEGGQDVGAVYLVLGPVGPSGENLGQAEAKFVGGLNNGDFGYAFDGAGDVDGDGFADVIIGDTTNNMAGLMAGAAFLFSGPLSGTMDAGDADAAITGQSAFNIAGTVVAGVGDLNNDGFGDVAIAALGSPLGQDGDGDVYVVNGPVTGTVSLANADARLHSETLYATPALDAAGDVNDDGIDDLLIGADVVSVLAEGSGVVYVEFGPVGGTHELNQADVRLSGVAFNDLAGSSVAGAGDTNADGVDDILVGAPFGYNQDDDFDVSGAAYLFLGSLRDHTPPIVRGVPFRIPNELGWYRAPVSIDWQATDDSGQATDPPDTIAASEGSVEYSSGPSCDRANNCAIGRLSLSIDLSDPTVTCNPASFTLNQPGARVSASVADGVSGPLSSSISAAVSSATVGPGSVSLTGTDRAGRATTVSCPYRVIYAFTGFFAPVSSPPAVNGWLGGIPVPIRFALHGNQGSSVVSGATVTPVDCATKVAIGPKARATISSTVYSSVLGQYAFLWATNSSWRGTCRLFEMTLRDGTTHGALFRFAR